MPPEQDKQCPGYGNWWEAKVAEAMDSPGKPVQPKRCGLIQVSGLFICHTAMLVTRTATYASKEIKLRRGRAILAAIGFP